MKSFTAVNGMDHVERASVIAMFRKKKELQIRISRSILGVGQKIEYLGPSTHRGGSNGVFRLWFRNTTAYFIGSIQYSAIKNQ